MLGKGSEELKREPTGGSRWTNSGVKYFFEPKSGYWNCGSMTHACQLCSALHFLGDKSKQPGSTLTNPKFSDCCSSSNITPVFPQVLLASSVISHLKTKKGEIVCPIPENSSFLAVPQCQKSFLLFQSLPLFFESF